MTNPLQQYFRVAKTYVRLPTKGAYNAPQDIDFAANFEVGVSPLTAIDHMMLKTPDALLNGETLLKVVQSCVPAVKNIKKLTQPDINVIMVAIRVASNGPIQEFDCSCPKCKHDNHISVNLAHYLDTCDSVTPHKSVDLGNDLVVYVRPFDFEQRNLQLINDFEETKAVRSINNSTDKSEADQMHELSEHINKSAHRLFDLVSKSVVKIVIKSNNQTVTEPEHIREFIASINKHQSDVIIDSIRELNEMGIQRTASVECQQCAHQWQQDLDFDPTSFFD